MKKIVGILTCLSFIFLSGCSFSQPIAAEALKSGLAHQDKVFNNTADKLAQSVLNAGADQAVVAAASSDPVAAQAAIKFVFDEMNDLAYLKVQWEKGLALLSIPQEFIWGQQSYLQLTWSEWKKAEESTKTPTTQPVKK